MALYNIGDRVIVRPDLKNGQSYAMIDGSTYDVAIRGMVELAGRVLTIKDIVHGVYRVCEYGCGWTDTMFCGKEQMDDLDIPVCADDLI